MSDSNMQEPGLMELMNDVFQIAVHPEQRPLMESPPIEIIYRCLDMAIEHPEYQMGALMTALAWITANHQEEVSAAVHAVNNGKAP
jgi:hypothetical protein